MPKIPNNLADASAFTLTGHRVDLAAPKVTSILVTDLAEQLAKLAMFRGATHGLYAPARCRHRGDRQSHIDPNGGQSPPASKDRSWRTSFQSGAD